MFLEMQNYAACWAGNVHKVKVCVRIQELEHSCLRLIEEFLPIVAVAFDGTFNKGFIFEGGGARK